MALCDSCSAPLPPDTHRCSYCNVRNDIDLKGKHRFTINSIHSNRICPHCNKPLQTIKLDFNGPFHIERCNTCLGLFFDPGEIETLLENSVSKVFDINLKLIENINKDRYKKNKKVKYIKCPVCRILMNRINFGHHSGVIIDKCKNHGIWVDSGEITHLMEWKKAGGALLHVKNKEKQRKKKNTLSDIASNDLPFYRQPSKNLETELLEAVSSFVFELFT